MYKILQRNEVAKEVRSLLSTLKYQTYHSLTA